MRARVPCRRVDGGAAREVQGLRDAVPGADPGCGGGRAGAADKAAGGAAGVCRTSVATGHPVEARGRGVFRALYEHVVALARRDPGVAGLRLYVDRDNHAAQETYSRLGMAASAYLLYERSPV